VKSKPESQSSAEVSSAASEAPKSFACGGLRYFRTNCEEVGQGCEGYFRRPWRSVLDDGSSLWTSSEDVLGINQSDAVTAASLTARGRLRMP
jgi:hypothetical protein